jgi:outer membrane lipoprotein SlyB
LSNSKILGGWKFGSRNGHVESDEEYTARRRKEEEDAAKKRTRHIKRAADTAHMIGTLATGAGTAGLLLTNPVTALGAIAGGIAGEKAVDYGLGKLADMTGSKVRSWKDLTDKYLGWSPTL